MITVRHTHQDGTLIEGTSKGDGVLEIAKRHGFRYFPSIGMIGIRGSRDHMARRYQIDGLAAALRAAGYEVQVEIDDTHRPRADVLADQAARLDDRYEALDRKAARRAAEADAHEQAASRLSERFVFGQPTLVGHHSQPGAERDRRRMQDHDAKAAECDRKARETARRAEAVGSAADYSATPQVTARRIKTAEAELRKIQRDLDGYTRRFLNNAGEVMYVDPHAPATGEWRERLLVREAQLDDQLAYDRVQLEQAKADGRYVEFGPHNVHVGDAVSRGSGWHKVVKVNKKTVSVDTGYTWTDKIPFTDIRKVHPAGEDDPR